MPNFSPIADQPLGSVLQQAGLVSQEQIQIALHLQQRTNQRIGEIFAAQGWIKQASADFFAESWPQLVNRSQQQSIGQYLKQAALLDDQQIESILSQQQDRGLKFGTLAVLNGWVRHQTISFFLRQMGSLELDAPQLIPKYSQPQSDEDPTVVPETDNSFALLQLYRQILEQGSVKADGSAEQVELLKTGLVVIAQNHLELAPFEPEFEVDLEDSDRSFPSELGFAQPRPYDHIRLRLFDLESCSARPYRVFSEVLGWTGNQPDLTQKLCQMIRAGSFIPAGAEADQVARQVHNHLIQNWESSAAAAPLRTLCDRLFKSRFQPQALLQLYNRCLEQTHLLATGSPEEQELLQLGFVVETDGTLHVANKLYRFVFNHAWVAQMLQMLTDEATQISDLPATLIPSDLPATVPLMGNEPLVTAASSSTNPSFLLSKKAFWLGLGAVLAGFLTVAGLRSCQKSLTSSTHALS